MICQIEMTRREFIKNVAIGSLSVGLLTSPLNGIEGTAEAVTIDGEHIFVKKEAMYYEKLAEGQIKCKLCPKECEVENRERGWCGARENEKGIYYTMTYANPCAVHIDPIEKMPFFHFLPSTWTLSVSTAACNLNCKYCQNWQFSQRRPEQTENVHLPSSQLVKKAIETGCKSIAHTYAEPVAFYEWMLDNCKEAKKSGMKSVVVSAGYLQKEPLKKLCQFADAIKIDLKAFTDKFYTEICSATLKPVLDNLKTLKESDVWFEVVDLIVPTLNDSEEEFKELVLWVRENLGVDVPLHFSRFYPSYQLKNLPLTPLETVEKARQIGLNEGLNYVYIGNVPGHPGESTYCPNCKQIVIQRFGFKILRNDIVDGKCKKCGHEIPGVWNEKFT